MGTLQLLEINCETTNSDMDPRNNTGVAIIFLGTRTRVLAIFIMVVLLSNHLEPTS